MTFPTIPTVAAGRVLSTLATSPAGTHTSPNLSSLTKNSGDLLVAIVIIYDGNSTNAEFSSWGGGFTEVKDQATTTTMAIGVAYKVSNGSETGTFTVTSADASTNDSCFFLISIPGAHTTLPAPEATSIANGTSAAADPASLSPSWGAADTLWIAVAGSGETATAGSFTGIASAPTNYTDYVDSGISADVVGGVEGALAFRQLNAASENVGPFSVDTSNARNSALLIAIRPAPAVTEFTPSPVVATLAVPSPTIATSLSLAPAPVAAVLAVPNSTVQNVIVLSPSPVALTLGIPVPTISTPLSLAPSPVAATLAVPTPALATSLSLAPAPVPAVLAVPNSVLGLVYTLSPAAVAALLAVPDSTLSLGGGTTTLTPDPVATVLSVPASSLSTSLSLQPAAVATVLSVPAPVLEKILSLSPAPVPVTLAVPAPLLAYAQTISPAPVVLVLGVPEPTLEVAVFFGGSALSTMKTSVRRNSRAYNGLRRRS